MGRTPEQKREDHENHRKIAERQRAQRERQHRTSKPTNEPMHRTSEASGEKDSKIQVIDSAASILLLSLSASMGLLVRPATAEPLPNLPQTGAPEASHVRIEIPMKPGNLYALPAGRNIGR